VTLLGTLPEKTAIAIPEIFGVGQINARRSPHNCGIPAEDGDAKDHQKKDPEGHRKIDRV
jgi:hypothetical protein